MRNVKRLWCKLTSVLLTFVVAVCSMLSYSSRTHAVQKTDIDFMDVKMSEDYLKDMAEELIWLVNKARAEENVRIREENKVRAANGEELLPELKQLMAVPYLSDKARERSREIISNFDHYRPGKRYFIFNDDVTTAQLMEVDGKLKEQFIYVTWDEGMRSFSTYQNQDGIDKMKEIIGKDIGFKVAADEENVFATILDTNLVPYSGAGENLAAGRNNAEETFEQWMNSPGHKANILKPEWTHIGVGCSYEPNSKYGYYWTQMFVAYDYDLYGPLENEYVAERFQTVPKGAGDINGDGEINSYDLITINKYLAGEILLNDLQKESCDLLKDNTITSADASLLRWYILGKATKVPVTFEEYVALLLADKQGQ